MKFLIAIVFFLSSNAFACNKSLDEPIAMKVNDMSVEQLLKNIAKTKKLNILVGKQTKALPNVSLDVKDVKLSVLFDSITKAEKTSWKVDENDIIQFN